MTNAELADIVCGTKPFTIRISRDGCFVRRDGEADQPITGEQAGVALLAFEDILRSRRGGNQEENRQ